MSGFKQQIGVNYYDLSAIFLPRSSGPTAATSHFISPDGNDLSLLFVPLSNQPCNLTVNYNCSSLYQSKYFTPTAAYSTTTSVNGATISISSAAFNSLAITGSGTATIAGVSGTTTYSKSFTGLLPASNYTYVCTPSNTGTSPAATTTAVSGTATTLVNKNNVGN